MRSLDQSSTAPFFPPSKSSTQPKSRTPTKPLRRVSSLISEGGTTIASPRTPKLQAPKTTRITATATPARAPRPTVSSNARAPLAARDHNVQNVKSTRSSVGKVAMPFEKGPNANARQPLTPSLSAVAVKASNRAPLTPKIATKTPQAAAVTTPLARRNRGENSASSYAAGPSSSGVLKDDGASSVPCFLSSNITPRSGSRQSRVESANSTPNGTPIPDRHDGWDTRSGLGLSGTAADYHLPRAVTFSPVSDVGSGPRQDAQSQADSRFFYASDAKGVQQSQSKPLPSQNRAPTFFYANGDSIRNKTPNPASPLTSSPVLGQATEPLPSKFVYANGTPDLQAPFKPTISSRPGSTVSTSSRVPARTTASTPAGPVSVATRPPSPKKMASQPSLVGGRSLAQKSINITRSPVSIPPPLGGSALGSSVSTGRRRISIDTTPRSANHSTTSLPAADSPTVAKVIASLPSSEASSPASVSNRTMTMASIVQAAEDLAPPEESKLEGTSSDLQSPTKSTHGSDQLNELVANARRERKVQDLEITNASLEAINRTLERQLRKQTAELRRYRRLSRSGRFSLASTVSSLPPDSIPGISAIDGLSLSDLSEEEPDDETSSIYESDDLSDTDSASTSATSKLSPNSRLARDSRRRKRDEHRLQLDLSKHRDLLIDSQKINQSLKRCLNWTEELIKEGRKALEYQVRVSDVELGGRVLAPEDDSEHDESGLFDGTLRESAEPGSEEHESEQSGSETPLVNATKDEEVEPPWSKEPQDRDSGIELPA